jgi:hypothetical protein
MTYVNVTKNCTIATFTPIVQSLPSPQTNHSHTIYTMGVQPCYGTRPRPLLWAGSQAAHKQNYNNKYYA